MRQLVQCEQYGLEPDTRQALLSLRVLQQMDGAILCLLQQPSGKAYLPPHGWPSLRQCCEGGALWGGGVGWDRMGRGWGRGGEGMEWDGDRVGRGIGAEMGWRWGGEGEGGGDGVEDKDRDRNRMEIEWGGG